MTRIGCLSRNGLECIARWMRVSAAALSAVLVFSSVAWAQRAAGAPAAPVAAPALPKDALGRDTPLGTVTGFMEAGRAGKTDVLPLYLDTDLQGPAASDLARQLYVVLDSRLPVRLNQLSDRPEGSPENLLKPDQDVVGTINTSTGSFDVHVVRVNRRETGPVWLFSRQTLASIPEAYGEVNLVRVDRFLPSFLTQPRIFGIRLFEWMLLLIALPLCYGLLGTLNWAFKPLMAYWHRRFGGPAAEAVPHVPGLIRLLILATVIRWVLRSLDLPLSERRFWTTVSALMIIVSAGWVLLLVNDYGERYIKWRFASEGEVASLLRVVRRFADGLVVVACVLVTLRYFGFDPTTALAGLGIGGIAVALAAQKTLENVIAGLSLIFDKAVRVGDAVKVGEISGTVDYIGLRSTRIRTPDRTIVSVPNGQIAGVGIETFSVRDKFWFHHVVGLRYDTTAAQMRAVIDGVKKLLVSTSHVDPASVRVRFVRLGAFSLDIEIAAYVFARDFDVFADVQQELLLRIMDTVDRAGTAIAIPAQTLHIDGRLPGLEAESPSPVRTAT